MSLNAKVLSILVAAAVLSFGAVQVMQRFVFLPRFLELEREAAVKDMERCVTALELEIGELDSLCASWASTGVLYVLAEAGDRDGVAGRFPLSVFEETGVEAVYVFDPRGRVLWGAIYDLATGQPESAQEFPRNGWAQTHPLLRNMEPGSSAAGVMLTQRGPMMVAARPILHGDGTGSRQGTLVVGRVLDDTHVATVQAQTGVAFRFWPLYRHMHDPDIQARAERLAQGDAYIVEKRGGVMAEVYASFPSVMGGAALLLRADVPVHVAARGRSAMRFATWTTLLGTLAVLLIVMILIRNSVTDPLARLTRHVTTVARSSDLAFVEHMEGGDEVGALAREFNEMVRRIQEDAEQRRYAEEALGESEKRALEAQHLASIGEMSTSIAHEIRNPLAGMSGAIQVLRDGLDEDDERREVMSAILDQVDRVDKTVQSLLAFAKNWTADKRPVDLGAIAKQVVEAAGERPEFGGIRMVVEAGSAEAMADAELLEQVLWNLFHNAAQAMDHDGEIRCRCGEADGAAFLWVSDTGPGFGSEDGEAFFRPFYTTKTRGTGLGLAICRRILDAHGGSIRVGNGADGGAEVIIEFPIGD